MLFDARAFIAQLTTQPGVYRMYGGGEALLYVGKARNLKKRVASYFLRASGSPRIEAMVAQIRRIEVTVTHTEDEALVLEASLIKQLAPRYNVSLRDDKSFPYLVITGNHAYPRIAFHRGAKDPAHRYFGPYPSAGAVRETLVTLQKLFRLRPCSDSFFAHRTRPCLQHQIRRCSAPCVANISEAEYARDVTHGVQLLEGKGDELSGRLASEMEQASTRLDFEGAARLRDQIAALHRLQSDRALASGSRDLDVIAVAPHASGSCITVLSVRNGQNLGHRSFFPSHAAQFEMGSLLGDFLEQYYLERTPPAEVLVPEPPDEADWLEHWLSERAGRRTRVLQPRRGQGVRLMKMTHMTAEQNLSARRASSSGQHTRLAELQRVLALEQFPQRLECFDISHTGGEAAVAACVVFGSAGPLKASYRRFNIQNVAAGDDYAAIRQAVLRRFARLKKGEGESPDVLFIDGGRGQLNAALEALQELGIHSRNVVAVSKGAGRRPGLEQLHLPDEPRALKLPPDSPALHLVQQIRDEAHRFAITGHRGRRDQARVRSALDAIEGLGPLRKRVLLNTLGGVAQIRRAGIDDLARVPGISRTLAERIYRHFH
jgi:excinuclease ABC subunit C